MAARVKAVDGATPAPVETTACEILARVDGVFCAGQRHAAVRASYPDGWFSARQLAELRAHPDLEVWGVLEADPTAAPEGGTDPTAAPEGGSDASAPA